MLFQSSFFILSTFFCYSFADIYGPRLYTKAYTWELDTDKMIKNSKFPLKPAALIKLSKRIINDGVVNPDDLAEDFVFQFPIVGPLNKKRYLRSLKSFKLKEYFPDFNEGVYDFRIDPFEPNRVWFTGAATGTHSVGGEVFGKPTGKRIVSPPCSCSFIFNECGQVTKFTGGYVMDKGLGNTGGLGAVFGIFNAIGRPLPFREGKPWKPSFGYKLFTTIGNFLIDRADL